MVIELLIATTVVFSSDKSSGLSGLKIMLDTSVIYDIHLRLARSGLQLCHQQKYYFHTLC